MIETDLPPPVAGGYLPDEYLPAFVERVGQDRLISIAGGPHSPHRTHPIETTAALVRALEAWVAMRCVTRR